MTRWRFVDAGETEPAVSFGRFPAIAAGVAMGGQPVLMTSVWRRAHFNIGWFDDVDAVIDMDAARSAGVDVVRRPVFGGGTAFYDTMANANFSFIVGPAMFETLDQALEHFRPVMEAILAELELGEARFEGSSDVRWQGRKLGTLISQSVMGTKVVGAHFNLKRPDLELYRRVARVPEEKFADKAIKDMVEYICTPADIRGRDLSYEEFRDAVVAAARDVAGLDLEPSATTPEEEAGTKDFVNVVSGEEWINRVSSSRFDTAAPKGTRIGFANVKAKKLVRSGVAIAEDGTIAAAMMAGDMHLSPPEAMERVATALVGADAGDRQAVLARIREVFEQPDMDQPDEAAGVTPEDCAEAVLRAAKAAR
ncbi:MAG: biotin/lipoate A/B protein ligase family protein [Actinomycetota bacterium]